MPHVNSQDFEDRFAPINGIGQHHGARPLSAKLVVDLSTFSTRGQRSRSGLVGRDAFVRQHRMFQPRLVPATKPAIAVPAQAATIQIVMQDLVFAPTEVSVHVGDTIEWVNRDVFAHTATARDGDFDLNLPPKETVTSMLSKAGTIEYYCRYHPHMKAVLKIAP